MKPAGRPLSTIFLIGNAAEDKPMQEAVDAAASVHGDGTLSPLPLVRDDARDREGAYFHEKDTSRPVQITVSRHAIFPRLSCVHEIGHFLDHQALGNGRFASEVSLKIADWRHVVNKTESIQWMNWLRSVNDADQFFLSYALSWPELFARAYTQYIALHCRNAKLKQEFHRIEDSPTTKIYRIYWQKADFSPVAEAIDRLFLSEGWLQ